MPNSKADNEKLEHIRKRVDYMKRRWLLVRQAGMRDMKALSGDPWPDAEKTARAIAGQERPCLVFDELNQYTNKLINDARMKQLAIVVDPRGDGATDETARWRADKIRQIQYKSNALDAFIGAFTGGVERSYGFCRVTKKYIDDESMDQELCVEPIPNPDSVLIDPDFIQPNASDINDACIFDYVNKDDFKRKWPKATITDFQPFEGDASYKDWLMGEQIQIGEYWERETTKRTLMFLQTDAGVVKLFLDEAKEEDPEAKIIRDAKGDMLLMGGKETPIKRMRKVESHKVCSYLTNGFEILEETLWDGKYIPLGVMLGKEQWVPNVTGSERRFISLVRMAFDPYMAYCWTKTSEVETAGQMPKSPAIAYVGQMEGQEADWKASAKIPKSYLQVHAYTDEYPMGSGSPLPIPQRNNYAGDLQQLELLAESCRRAIQAAMGISPLPTAAQRANEKSKIALDKIEEQEAAGSYHFVQRYEGMIKHVGVILNDLLASTIDTERDEGLRSRDGKHRIEKVNNADGTGMQTSIGSHDVTISTGPNEASQREAVSDTVENLIQADGLIPAAIQGNPKAAKIVGLAFRLKNGGPLMDEIANVLDPEDAQGSPMEAAQQLDQAKQMLQAAQAEIQKLQQLANPEQTKLAIAKMNAQVELAKDAADNKAKIEVALIAAHGKIADTATQEQGLNQRQAHQAHHDAAGKVLDLQVAEIGRQDQVDQQKQDREMQQDQFQQTQAAATQEGQNESGQ